MGCIREVREGGAGPSWCLALATPPSLTPSHPQVRGGVGRSGGGVGLGLEQEKLLGGWGAGGGCSWRGDPSGR